MTIARALAACAGLIAATGALASPAGSLDSTFGNGGIARPHVGPSWDEPAAVRVDASGRIIVAGTSQNPDNTDFAIVRYTAAGAVDTTFGNQGRTITPIGGFDDTASALAVQPDGKYVVAGTYIPDTNAAGQIALVRYTSTGLLDTTFGTGGIVTTAAAELGSSAGAVAVQADGKIVVAATVPTGSDHYQFIVLRYTSAGALDTTFGTGGIATISFGENTGTAGDGANAILVQPDGRILVGGRMTADSGLGSITNNVAVVRLNSDGTPDAGFGTGGRVLTYAHGPKTSLALQADGKIVAGNAFSDFGRDIAVFRYNANGSPDTGFGSNGKAILAGSSSSDEWVSGVALQSDGKIVVSGRGISGWLIGRFTAAGATDTTFGSSGRFGLGLCNASPHNNGTSWSAALAVQGDNKIVSVGAVQQQSLDFGVLRMLADGSSFDFSFASGGGRCTDLGNGSPGTWTRVHVRPDGRVVATGAMTLTEFQNTPYSYVAAAGFLANGAPDPTFGTNGVVTTTLGSGTQIVHKSSVLQPDGKLVVAAYHAPPCCSSSANLVLLRYHTSGLLDAAFGSGGKVIIPADFATQAADVALQPDGKIVLYGRNFTDLRLHRFSAFGVADSSFGTSGVATLAGSGTPMRVGVRSDGTIVTLSYSGSGNFTLTNFAANGTVDTAFGAGGNTTVTFGGYYTSGAASFGLQPDGKVVVASTIDWGNPYELGVARVLTDGSFDTAFSGGVAHIQTGPPFGPSEPIVANAIAFQADGRILLGGSIRRVDPATSSYSTAGDELAVLRITSAGVLDPSFGVAGVVVTPTAHLYDNAQDRFDAMALAADGRLTALGSTFFAGEESFTLVRYLTAPGARTVGGLDFDATGAGDVLWTRADGRHAIWLMNAAAVIGGGEIMGAGTGWSVALVADLDGNGKTDLVWQHTDGRVAVYLMNGATPASQAQILNAGAWRVSHAADLNGDGKADLVFRHTDGSVAAWLMNGTAVAGGATIMGPGSSWSVARVGDFDGDGKDDLLWSHTDGSQAIWLMDGAALKTPAQILNAGSWSVSQVADLNGDGKADIVWQHADGTIVAWLMNGVSYVNGATLVGAGTGWTVARAADFDGDAHADLLFQHPDGRAAIWLMQDYRPKVPLSGPTQAQVLNAGDGWFVKRVMDMDNDGRADIVWQHTDGSVAVWLMSGVARVGGGGILGAGSGWSVSPAGQ